MSDAPTIERLAALYEQVLEDWTSSLDDGDVDRRYEQALDAMIKARPVSLGGIITQLRWLADELRHGGGAADLAAPDVLDHAVSRLEELSERC